jgi:ADP-heptose:LPS heptosyltransferase
MNIRVMKAIDHYLGIPVCLVLDVFSKVAARFPPRTMRMPRKILIMKYFGMGSILLASPMIRGIKEKYPDASIGFLTFVSNRNFVERLQLVDAVFTLRTDTMGHFLADLLHQVRRIRQERFDVTIDMEFFTKFSTIMTYLSGSPVRIGYYLRQLWRGDLLTHQIYYNHYKHITEVFGALAVPLGVEITDYSLRRPHVSAAERDAAAALLAREGIGEHEPLIGINVNVSDLALERRWPKEEFQRLIEALFAELRVRLVFIGGPGEVGYVEEVISGLACGKEVTSLAGKTALGELLAVMERFSILITNDSGPLHLASSVGTPTVSFFGPETPALYGPVEKEPLVFYAGIYCSPCLNVFNAKTATCAGRNVCMTAMDAATVMAAMKGKFPELWEHHGRDTSPSTGR